MTWEFKEVKGSYHSLWSFGKLKDNSFRDYIQKDYCPLTSLNSPSNFS